MLKLLARYKETRHVNDARRLVQHVARHPMSACAALGDDVNMLNEAIALVKQHAANDAELTEVKLP